MLFYLQSFISSSLFSFYSQHGVTDCSWSEQNEFHLVSSCADGSIKLWDLVASSKDGFPLRNFAEHQEDVASVSWNPIVKDSFLSGSWDSSIKLWRPETPHSLVTYVSHSHSVFEVAWNVHQPTVFASCSGKRNVYICMDSSCVDIINSSKCHNK